MVATIHSPQSSTNRESYCDSKPLPVVWNQIYLLLDLWLPPAAANLLLPPESPAFTKLPLPTDSAVLLPIVGAPKQAAWHASTRFPLPSATHCRRCPLQAPIPGRG